MKKMYAKIIMFVILIVMITVPKFSYAVDTGLGDLDSYKGAETNSQLLQDKAETVVGALQVIGTSISVITLIAIGIKYMLGSVEEKAEYKKTLVPYLIGAFLVFTVTLVPQIVYKIMQNF